MNTFCNEPGSSLRVSHHTGLRAAEAGNNDGGLADLERRRQRRSGAVDGERQRQSGGSRAAEAGSNDGGLADLERRRQRRSRAVDGEQRRQAATTEARRSGEAEAAAIWRGGSRAAEAGSNDGGSPIWSGLVMAIWSGGSRAAEAAAAAEAATEARTEKSESTRGVSTKKRRRMGATGREK
ncbi:uncharacterized protein LOC108326184 [Vigna angularis]|uniref:uncharacterized protein LOC108326184 n=1 Tax=Phaseolus angularis TaxID=3914 RepID=UPI00080A22D5|nr:uncharacterized protein LOC108326184 [Vigna angularis]